MTVWYHLSTILKCKIALRTAGLIAICVAIITTLFLNSTTYATAGINQTLSFQGRLLTQSGGVVADGYYNMQFKIYKGGTASGGGTQQWFEDYVNNNNNEAVQVKNGYFSVTLGSKTALSSVDWNDDTLYLSMNIGGTAAGCTSFGSGPCVGDGEMQPMKRITSVPYAMQAQNANTLGNKTAANFIQLAQGVQTDAASGVPSVFINKTGSGNLIQLQKNGADVLNIGDQGDITFGSGTSHSITIGTPGTGINGRNLTVSAGNGGSGIANANGGDLILQGGESNAGGGNGGNVIIDAGISWGGTSGVVEIGSAMASAINIGSPYGNNQSITIGAATAGTSNTTIGSSQTATAGTTTVQAKNNVNVTAGGNVNITAGTGNSINIGGASTTTVVQGALQASNLDTVGGSELTIGSTNASTVSIGKYDGYVINNGISAIGNLIENPGLEANAGVPIGWWGGTSVANSGNAHSGNNYLQIAGGGSIVNALNGKFYAVQPGQVIYYEGYLRRAAGATGNAGFFIEAMDKDMENAVYSSGEDWSQPGTTYEKRWNTYTVPAGKYFIAFGITVRESSSGNFYFDDTSMRLASESGPKIFNGVNSTSAFQIQNASSTSLLTADTTNMQIVIGSGGNTITLSSNGISLAGNARGTKQIRLAAEYQNTVLHNGTGSNNNGTMTSSLDLSGRMNYYNWTATSGTAQTYDIVTQIPIPQDFSAWAASNPLAITSRTDSTSNGLLTMELRDSSDAVICNFTSLTMGSANSWITNTPNCLSNGSGTYTPGDYLTVRLRMSAKSNANVAVGNIVLNYLSSK